MDITDFDFVRLREGVDIKSFDCGNTDLDDFLINEALDYSEELLAVTYLFMTRDEAPEVVAFFSVCNDILTDIPDEAEEENKKSSRWNNLNRRIPNVKRKKKYPSVLLARLGVNKAYQGNGLGEQIVDFLKGWFSQENKTGCRFLIVDAYNKPKVLNFYKDNGFSFLVEQAEEDEETRFMYYDLKRFVPTRVS